MIKKLTFLFVGVLFILFASSKAQAQNAFEKGRVIGTAGLILQSGATPVTVAAEYGVADDIGVGGRLTYQSSSGVSVFSISVLGNYHFARLFQVNGDKLDPYAGLSIGKGFVSGSGYSGSSKVYLAGQIGARYLVNDKIGPYAQINLGFVNSSGSSFEIGVAYKFGQ